MTVYVNSTARIYRIYGDACKQPDLLKKKHTDTEWSRLVFHFFLCSWPSESANMLTAFGTCLYILKVMRESISLYLCLNNLLMIPLLRYVYIYTYMHMYFCLCTTFAIVRFCGTTVVDPLLFIPINLTGSMCASFGSSRNTSYMHTMRFS